MIEGKGVEGVAGCPVICRTMGINFRFLGEARVFRRVRTMERGHSSSCETRTNRVAHSSDNGEAVTPDEEPQSFHQGTPS